MSASKLRRCLPLLLLLGTAPSLAAQVSQFEGYPWRLSNFPYLMGDPNNGLLIIGHAHLAREADYEARIQPFDGYAGLEAAYGTRGSRSLTFKFRAPALISGWRFAADAAASREGRFGYYGFGPDGQSPGADTDADLGDTFFRTKRSRYYGKLEVTRHLKGRLSVAGAVMLTHFKFRAINDGDAFQTDFGTEPLSGTDAMGRLALVFDTRDMEPLTKNGLLFELGLYAGSGRFEQRSGGTPTFSGSGYTGAYGHFRGYVTPKDRFTLAGRVAMRALGANAPLEARYLLPGWERDLTVLGGADSHRGFVRGRLVGRGLFFASGEVRFTLVDVGDYGGISLIAFLDGGRTFEGGPKLSFSDWKVAGGGGIVLRVIRATLLAFNFAAGPDGFNFSMGNGWAF